MSRSHPRARSAVRSAARVAVLTAVAAGGLAACDGGAGGSDVVPLGSVPPVEGHVIGPQPGPDRPMPRIVNPFEGDVRAAAEGRRLFIWYNCYGCHGGRAGGGMGPTLRDWHWIYGGSSADIYSSIAQGRAHGMPAWGTKLPSEQIWKLVAYIETLGTSSEPDAPPSNRTFPETPVGRVIDGAAGER